MRLCKVQYAVCCSCNCMWTVSEFSAMSLNIFCGVILLSVFSFLCWCRFYGSRDNKEWYKTDHSCSPGWILGYVLGGYVPPRS